MGNTLCSIKRYEISCGGLRQKFHLEKIFERHASPVKMPHLISLKTKKEPNSLSNSLLFSFCQTVALSDYRQLVCQEIGARCY